jgi:hypothetical protein
VESTPVPTDNIAEFAHVSTPLDEQIDPYGFPGDGREIGPGQTSASLGPYAQTNAQEGKARLGEPQVQPAAESARILEKHIQDQLLDTNAVNVLRNAVFEAALLGTGIVKGPFNFYKKNHMWTRDPQSGERM